MTTKKKLVFLNILYGGIQLRGDTPASKLNDWWYIVYQMLLWGNDQFFTERLKSIPEEEHIVAKIIAEQDPDYLILNEVMPYLDHTINILEQNGYHIVYGCETKKDPPLTNATLIASKEASEKVNFEMMSTYGGGSCGVYIPESDLLLLSCHPSAFFRSVRLQQLKWAGDQLSILNKEYNNVIFAGDMNAEPDDVFACFDRKKMQCYSEPSFPTPELYNEMCKLHNSVMRYGLLGLSGEVRTLDYLFYNSDMRITAKQADFGSDHMGIVAVIG